jgi:hypothetical protein
MRAYNRPLPPLTVTEMPPRARHFMHTHGITDPALFAGSTFVPWIQRQWVAFATERDIAPDDLTNAAHGDDFDVWLQAKCGCGR